MNCLCPWNGKLVRVEADFGHYRLLDALGAGGMGQVFRAYDTVHRREVALKVLAPQVAQDPTFAERFRREAHAAAQMSEPHIIPIHSYGEIDGRLYVDMRLIAGRDLASVLRESGAMDPARAVGIVEQVADALDAAHSINLVHRDVKPSNILLGKRDFVHLIDFGLAQDVNATRLTQTGAAIGTFAYMAPERLDPGVSEPASDAYSLACVLFECLIGQLPFPGNSLQQLMVAHLSKSPPRPSAFMTQLPPAFDEVIAVGMAKTPADRYPTVTAFAEAARAALDRRSHIPQPDRNAAPREIPLQFAPTVVDPHPRAPVAAPGRAGQPPRPQVGNDPARWAGPPSKAQLPRTASFTAPGVLIAIFAALSMLIVIMAILKGGFVS